VALYSAYTTSALILKKQTIVPGNSTNWKAKSDQFRAAMRNARKISEAQVQTKTQKS